MRTTRKERIQYKTRGASKMEEEEEEVNNSVPCTAIAAHISMRSEF